jgi:hypothetical protein
VALTGYPTQNLLFAGSLPCLSSRANSSYGTNPTIPATACPLGVVGEVVPHVLLRAQAYGEGLARYRARDFAAAAEQFARIASDDPPAACFWPACGNSRNSRPARSGNRSAYRRRNSALRALRRGELHQILLVDFV